MVDDDQDAGIVVVRGADFEVVVLDQLVEISALDVFRWNRTSPGLLRTC